MLLTKRTLRVSYSMALVALMVSLAACGGEEGYSHHPKLATMWPLPVIPVIPAPASAAMFWVDGSSTVFPISEAMAEEFMAVNPDVRVTVGRFR